MTILVAVLTPVYGINSDKPTVVVVTDGANTSSFFTSYAGNYADPEIGLQTVFNDRLTAFARHNNEQPPRTPEEALGAVLYNNPFDAEVIDDFDNWDEAISWAQQYVEAFDFEIGVTGA